VDFIPGLSSVLLAFLLLPGQIRIQDDLGRRVALPSPARRVVSLAPSLTESLFAVGAGAQVVGVTDFCDYPPAARGIPRVGGMVNPSIETIVDRAPDLVVLSMEGNTESDFSRLLSLGIPAYVSNPRTLSGIYRSLRDLGTLTGHAEEARRVVDSLQRREHELRRRSFGPPVTALFLVSLQPLIAVGGNTLLNELMTLAGARNIAAGMKGNYPAISREAVLVQNPQVLLLTTDLPGDRSTLLSLFPEWVHLRALTSKQVFRLDADIVSRPGPRALEGLQLLSSCLHGGTP
jgi:iron complex transport system substrate-binding protein